MTFVQWLFHYFEIVKFSKEEKGLFLSKLEDLHVDIQAFYMLVDKTNGPKLIDKISDAKRNQEKDKADKKAGRKSKSNKKETEEDYPDLLSDEDKDLWQFMKSTPSKIKNDELKEETKFILPKRKKEDFVKSSIVEKLDKKPNLGFK